MPTSAPQFRPRGAPDREQQRRDQDRLRASRIHWRRWYALAIWCHPDYGIRANYLRENPFCVYCLAQRREVLASVVNHNPPHKGDWNRFISGPFESCCKAHHDSEVQARERSEDRAEARARRAGIGDDRRG